MIEPKLNAKLISEYAVLKSINFRADDSIANRPGSATADQHENRRSESASEEEADEALSEPDSNCRTPIAAEPVLVPCRVCTSNISATSSHICIICNSIVHPFCGDAVDEEGIIIKSQNL